MELLRGEWMSYRTSLRVLLARKVVSLRRSEEIRTSLVVMALLAGVHPCVGKTGPPHLTSYPKSATDGADFTLSCTPAQSRTLIRASSPGPESTRDSTALATEGQYTGPPSTEDKDMMTTALVDTAVSTKCGNVLPITAAVGSIIVAIVIVVAIATSVLLVRKYKQDIAERNSQMYSTMSRDPNTDNNYTELDHRQTGEKFPTSLSVDTEESPDYYNTAPADSQYQNPPASTE